MSRARSKESSGAKDLAVVAAIVLTRQQAPVLHAPAWIVQRAWSEFRLPKLQELIRHAISTLETLPPPEPIDSEPGGAFAGLDPVAEALRACCEELRDASGMPGAEADRARHCRAVRGYVAEQPAGWGDAFSHALGEYRKAATHALEVSFRRAAAA